MDINFVKEQFEIAKKSSHLSETIVIDIDTVEWMISEIEHWKERNSRYAELIEGLKMDRYTLDIDCKFKYYTIERYEKVLKQIASGKKGVMDVNRIWLMRMAQTALGDSQSQND
jgi:hypothetical protein